MTGTTYAKGTKAWGICQKCGLRHLLNDLLFDSHIPWLRVCRDCWDPKHPQERAISVTDPQALWRPSPEPGGPTAPVLTAVLNGSDADLSWTESTVGDSIITTYALYQRTNDGEWLLVDSFDVARDIFGAITSQTLSYTVNGLTSDTTYDWYVQAIDAHRRSANSNTDSLEIAAPESNTLGIRVAEPAGQVAELIAPGVFDDEYTACGWSRAPLGDDEHVWSIKSFFNDFAYADITVQDIGLQLNVTTSDGPVTVDAPGTDWFFWAIRIYDVGGDVAIQLNWAAEGETSFSPDRQLIRTFASGESVQSFQINLVQLAGSQISGTNNLDVEYSMLKQWVTRLTDEELLAEKDSINAVKFVSLFSDNPMQGQDDLSDGSGFDRGPVLTGLPGFDYLTVPGPFVGGAQ